MVFTVNIPDRRGISTGQRKQLTRLGDDVVTREGEHGRYRPVEVGDALLVSVNAESEEVAKRLVADVIDRNADGLVATARDWVKPAATSVSVVERPATGRRTGQAAAITGRDDTRAKAVGAIIRSRRESRGISLRAFARQCDLSPAHVSKIERGLASPSLETLTRIVKELDLHSADLFGRPEQGSRQARVVRAADAEIVPSDCGGEVRVAAETSGATVLLGRGGIDTFGEPQISPRQVITVVFAGAVEVRVGEETVALQAGDTLVVPSLVPHAIRVTGGPDTRTAYITSDEGQPGVGEARPAA